MKEVVLELKDVHVSVHHKGDWKTILHDIFFKVYKGEKIAILGPSGVGKTTLLESVGQINSWSGKYKYSGNILFKNLSVLDLNHNEIAQLRGNKISFIFQEPQAGFDPLLICGVQVVDVLVQHSSISKEDAKKVVLEKFAQCNIPDPDKTFYTYPHQLSGGQLQRIMCVMAMMNDPDLILADEPTSSLDENNRDIVLDLLETTRQNNGTAIVMVTHDWLFAKKWADRIFILNEGTITDQGSIEELEKNSSDTFTKSLFSFENTRSTLSKTHSSKKLKTNDDSSFVLDVKNISKSYPSIIPGGARNQIFSNIQLSLLSGKTVGIVGPSGCGKSTLARCILRLEETDGGQIFWQDKNVSDLDFDNIRRLRNLVQIVFQDTNLSLPPHYTIRKILQESIRQNTSEKSTVSELLLAVGLDTNLALRFPYELSGGQRQRVCIARALALSPKVIVFDEVLSMLDPISQLQIVNLLLDIQLKKNIGYIFITHDKNWLEVFTDDILLMI